MDCVTSWEFYTFTRRRKREKRDVMVESLLIEWQKGRKVRKGLSVEVLSYFLQKVFDFNLYINTVAEYNIIWTYTLYLHCYNVYWLEDSCHFTFVSTAIWLDGIITLDNIFILLFRTRTIIYVLSSTYRRYWCFHNLMSVNFLFLFLFTGNMHSMIVLS